MTKLRAPDYTDCIHLHVYYLTDRLRLRPSLMFSSFFEYIFANSILSTLHILNQFNNSGGCLRSVMINIPNGRKWDLHDRNEYFC